MRRTSQDRGVSEAPGVRALLGGPRRRSRRAEVARTDPLSNTHQGRGVARPARPAPPGGAPNEIPMLACRPRLAAGLRWTRRWVNSRSPCRLPREPQPTRRSVSRDGPVAGRAALGGARRRRQPDACRRSAPPRGGGGAFGSRARCRERSAEIWRGGGLIRCGRVRCSSAVRSAFGPLRGTAHAHGDRPCGVGGRRVAAVPSSVRRACGAPGAHAAVARLGSRGARRGVGAFGSHARCPERSAEIWGGAGLIRRGWVRGSSSVRSAFGPLQPMALESWGSAP